MTLAPAAAEAEAVPIASADAAAAGRTVLFPAGLPGFPDARRFVLEPGGDSRPLRLRGLDGERPCFLVLPLGATPAMHDTRLDGVAAGLGIAAADLAILVVATRRDGATLRANLRAPLLLDTRRRLGWQVVLPAGPGVAAAA